MFPQDKKLGYEEFKKIKFDRQLPGNLQYPFQLDSLFLLNENDYPELATMITTFKKWDKRGDPESKGAAIFTLMYEYLKKKVQGWAPRQLSKQETIETFNYVKNYMQTNFGTTDLTLGDIQKLVRGGKSWPLGGFPDLLSPQWTEDYYSGRLKSIGGDGLIMFVQFPKTGLPKIETINMYGASAKAGNKHFDDQVEMYLQQKTKTMTLDKATVYKNAERVYHPH